MSKVEELRADAMKQADLLQAEFDDLQKKQSDIAKRISDIRATGLALGGKIEAYDKILEPEKPEDGDNGKASTKK